MENNTGNIIDVVHAHDDEFSKYMKCHGCREACPSCLCEDCCLEVEGHNEYLEDILPQLFFHLTRMVHMVDTCTKSCQCTEVRPCEIPVVKAWDTINNKVREIYRYIRDSNLKI